MQSGSTQDYMLVRIRDCMAWDIVVEEEAALQGEEALHRLVPDTGCSMEMNNLARIKLGMGTSTLWVLVCLQNKLQ
jgi:hypothetical protein